MKYILIEWPEVQELMSYDDFDCHAHLVNDEGWIDQYGPSSYFVEEDWLKKVKEMLRIYNIYIQIYNKLCSLNNIVLQENLLYLTLILQSYVH